MVEQEVVETSLKPYRDSLLTVEVLLHIKVYSILILNTQENVVNYRNNLLQTALRLKWRNLRIVYAMEPTENYDISTHRLQGDCSTSELRWHESREDGF